MFNKKVAVVQLDEGELEKALLASGSFANKLRIYKYGNNSIPKNIYKS